MNHLPGLSFGLPLCLLSSLQKRVSESSCFAVFKTDYWAFLSMKERQIPSSQPGTACPWRSAKQRRSGRPWWALCRLGSPGSWSCGWRPGPCNWGQLSDSHAGSCAATQTWRTPRSDTKVLFSEKRSACRELRTNTPTEKWGTGWRVKLLPSWLHAPNILMTCGWLTCFSRVNSDSRSRSSLWEAFSGTEQRDGWPCARVFMCLLLVWLSLPVLASNLWGKTGNYLIMTSSKHDSVIFPNCFAKWKFQIIKGMLYILKQLRMQHHWYVTTHQNRHGGGKRKNCDWVWLLDIQTLFWVHPI